MLAGRAGNQTILGSSDADLIDGGAGDDTLRGSAGNDYLLVAVETTPTNAMAAFGAPAGGEVVLTQTQRDQVNLVIAANWQ